MPETLRDRLREQLPRTFYRRLVGARFNHRPVHLKHPVTWTDKLAWRMLNDRRELLSWTCDKLAMKQYAQELVPDLRTAETYWAGTDVGELATVDLPDRWVFKPNHRAGVIHFGEGTRADVDGLRTLSQGWLDDFQGASLGEWAYSRARRLLVVEERLGGAAVPVDYKFYVFAGEVVAVSVDYHRFTDHHVTRVYSPDWEPRPWAFCFPPGPVAEPPASLDKMLSIAATLGSPFDFIRIDLYETEGQVALGELSPYPGGGAAKYLPHDIDKQLGALWTLPVLDRDGRAVSS